MNKVKQRDWNLRSGSKLWLLWVGDSCVPRILTFYYNNSAAQVVLILLFHINGPDHR